MAGSCSVPEVSGRLYVVRRLICLKPCDFRQHVVTDVIGQKKNSPDASNCIGGFYFILTIHKMSIDKESGLCYTKNGKLEPCKRLQGSDFMKRSVFIWESVKFVCLESVFRWMPLQFRFVKDCKCGSLTGSKPSGWVSSLAAFRHSCR